MTQQWKRVPVEPTPEILAAAAVAVWPTASEADIQMARAAAKIVLMSMDAAPGSSLESITLGIATMAPAYRAMLAAAPTPPASAQDDAKDERQAFEAWAKKKKMPLARIDEQYDDFWVDHAWNGWQARASVAAPAAGDAPEDLLHRLANPLTPYGLLARALRVATGTTLMDMARATGNTAAEISSIEFGRKEPDEGWFERAALFFASTSRGIVVPPSALKAAHARRAASQQQEG